MVVLLVVWSGSNCPKSIRAAMSAVTLGGRGDGTVRLDTFSRSRRRRDRDLGSITLQSAEAVVKGRGVEVDDAGRERAWEVLSGMRCGMMAWNTLGV